MGKKQKANNIGAVMFLGGMIACAFCGLINSHILRTLVEIGCCLVITLGLYLIRENRI